MNKKQLIGASVLALSFLFLTQALAETDIDRAFKEANAKFTFQGKPIHPGLVQEFECWFSDPGMPTTISVDVAARHGNEYFEDDVKVQKDGSVLLKKEESEGPYFFYKWLGKLTNDIHVLEVGESGGGSGVFGDLFFVRFDKGEGLTSEGLKYSRLLMTIVRHYSLGDRYEGKIELRGEKVIVDGETIDGKRKGVISFAENTLEDKISVLPKKGFLVVNPDDVKDWERLTSRQLKILQQEVDDGHQPWRLDPERYSHVFLLSYYNLDGATQDDIPEGTVIGEIGNVSVEVIYRNKLHKIYLYKPFPGDLNVVGGIWLIDKMEISDF